MRRFLHPEIRVNFGPKQLDIAAAQTENNPVLAVLKTARIWQASSQMACPKGG